MTFCSANYTELDDTRYTLNMYPPERERAMSNFRVLKKAVDDFDMARFHSNRLI
jgi:hypothetical protein